MKIYLIKSLNYNLVWKSRCDKECDKRIEDEGLERDLCGDPQKFLKLILQIVRSGAILAILPKT